MFYLDSLEITLMAVSTGNYINLVNIDNSKNNNNNNNNNNSNKRQQHISIGACAGTAVLKSLRGGMNTSPR